jgi:hypothetical protein
MEVDALLNKSMSGSGYRYIVVERAMNCRSKKEKKKYTCYVIVNAIIDLTMCWTLEYIYFIHRHG